MEEEANLDISRLEVYEHVVTDHEPNRDSHSEPTETKNCTHNTHPR